MTKKCGKGRQNEKAGREGGRRIGTGMMGRKGGEGRLKDGGKGAQEGKERREGKKGPEHSR